MASQRTRTLKALGLESWTPRSARAEAPPPQIAEAEARYAAPEPLVGLKAEPPVALDWDPLRAAIMACRGCRLCETRTQTVFGVGAPRASLMVVGEGPGADEDEKGEPFVGRAGKLLDEMLRSIGRSRS